MKRSRLAFKIIIQFVFSTLFFVSFLIGGSLLFSNNERTSFRNASQYAERSEPYKSVVFKYKTNVSIKNEAKANELKELINQFDGGTKYYSYGNLFGVTNESEVTLNNVTKNFHFADISYLDNNPVMSTSLLKLSGDVTKFNDAFGESNDYFDIDGDEIEIGLGKEMTLKSYLSGKFVESNLVTWSSADDQIVSIDKNGMIAPQSVGETVVTASFEKKNATIHVSVVPSNQSSAGILKTIPVVIPISLAKTFGDPNNSIGKTFTSSINDKKYNFKIGGYYENSATQDVFRNKFLFDNFGEQIYFLRSERYFIPADYYYLWVGTKTNVNIKIYNDMQLLKKICDLSFEMPDDLPTNIVHTSDGDRMLIKDVQTVRSSPIMIVSSVLMIISSIICSLICFICRKGIKTLHLNIIFLAGLAISLAIIFLINELKIAGLYFLLLTPFFGWCAIAVGIILTIIFFYQIIKFNKNNPTIIESITPIPVLAGSKNCIYIAKGANLPNQNASALRVDSIVDALIDEGYAFHVIGQTDCPKNSIKKINDNYYIHSTFDKRENAKNTIFDKLGSLYFPTEIILERILKILEVNKIDVIFIYQTLPIRLVRKIVRLCRKHKIILVFDIVEYQNLSQQRNISGILLNYFPSKRIIEKYTKYGRVISISTYLNDLFAYKNVPSIFVPFFFNVKNIKNDKYMESEKIRIIYAGAPFGNRDTIGNAVKGLLLLKKNEMNKFRFTFIGVSRDDMLNLGVTSDDLANTDKCFAYLGKQPHEKVIEQYSQSDYSLLLKPEEKRLSKAGFPTKVSESWALSTPVIANLSGDLNKFMKDGENGIVCENDSPESFAAALRKVLSIQKVDYLKMRKASRKTAVDKLNKTVYSKLIKEFVEKC